MIEATTATAKVNSELRFQTHCLVVSPLLSATEDRIGFEAALADIPAILTPAVVEHLPEPLHPADGADSVGNWVRARQAESCLLAVRKIGSQTVIGFVILADTSALDAKPTRRLGYMLAQRVWGKGHATELLTGLVGELRRRGWRGQILAGVSSANPGSSRVLLKCGFTELLDLQAPEMREFRLELA